MIKNIFFLRQALILAGLLSFRLIMDILMILKNQRWLAIDEATVGSMAIDILQRGVHPIYFYGQAYNGGASVEAHLISFIMNFTGVSPYAVKICAVILNGIIVISLFLFILKHWGKNKAFWTTLLYILSTVTIAWNLQLPGGYQETIILNLLMAHFFFSILEKGKKRSSFALLGFFTGFAIYTLELSAPFILSYLLFVFLYERRTFISKNIMWFVLFFAIGYSPALYYNFSHHFQNWSRLFAGDGLSSSLIKAIGAPFVLARIFGIRIFAKFFEPYNENIYAFDRDVSAASWIQLCLFIFAFVRASWKRRKALRNLIGRPFGNRSKITLPEAKMAFILIFILIQTFSTFSRPYGFRYLLPLFPFLLLCVIDLLDEGIAMRRLFYLAAAFLIVNGLYNYANLIPSERRCGQVTIVLSPLYLQAHPERCDAILELVKFLEEKGLRLAIAPQHDTLITFYSQKRVVGSRYPFYTDVIRADDQDPRGWDLGRSALVVYPGSVGELNALPYLMDMKDVKTASIDALRIYYPLNARVLGDVMRKTPPRVVP